jgi:hypothetical protein
VIGNETINMQATGQVPCNGCQGDAHDDCFVNAMEVVQECARASGWNLPSGDEVRGCVLQLMCQSSEAWVKKGCDCGLEMEQEDEKEATEAEVVLAGLAARSTRKSNRQSRHSRNSEEALSFISEQSTRQLEKTTLGKCSTD